MFSILLLPFIGNSFSFLQLYGIIALLLVLLTGLLCLLTFSMHLWLTLTVFLFNISCRLLNFEKCLSNNRKTISAALVVSFVLNGGLSSVISLCLFSVFYCRMFGRVFQGRFIVTFSLRKKYSYSPYSVRMLKNMDQNNSKYGHYLRSVSEGFFLFLVGGFKCSSIGNVA